MMGLKLHSYISHEKKNSFRFAYCSEQVKKKPGREVVTFLLVCNLAMWVSIVQSILDLVILNLVLILDLVVFCCLPNLIVIAKYGSK